nr:MinD/ParA family protein [Thermobifida cellulosilytica]
MAPALPAPDPLDPPLPPAVRKPEPRPEAEAAPPAPSAAEPTPAPEAPRPRDGEGPDADQPSSVRSRFSRNRPQLRQLLEEAQQRSAAPPPPAEDVPEPEPLPPLDSTAFFSPSPSPPRPTPPAPDRPAPGRPPERPEPPRAGGGPGPDLLPAPAPREPLPPAPAREEPRSARRPPELPAPASSPPVPLSAALPQRRSATPPGGVSAGPSTFAPPVVTPGREWTGGRRSSMTSGWRRAVESVTFGLIRPGGSRAERRRQELISRACTHVVGGHHRVAVLSLKGGVGKTTTTAALGSTLASLRGDRVLAVDANPDRGTLSDKLQLETPATIRDLLNEKDTISRYADIRAFTSQAPSRLEVLASDQDPAVSEALSEYDYREVSRIVEHFYSITLTDCGTGLLHSAMRGVLGLADQIIVVSTPSVDGARSASATLDWLDAHEYGALVRGAVVVLSMVRRNHRSNVDLQRLEEHFASRCRAVVRVPWDPHLEEGAEIHLERLQPATSDAYLELAAVVGEAFAWPR